MKKFLLIAFLFLGLKVYSQEVHLYSAQILEVKEKFDMKSVSSGTYSVYKRVFVIKESADLERAVTIFTDADRYLSSFSGTVTNSSGKVIKKLKKQDLEQRALAQELADDSYIYYYQVEAPYPFMNTKLQFAGAFVIRPRTHFFPVESVSEGVRGRRVGRGLAPAERGREPFL